MDRAAWRVKQLFLDCKYSYNWAIKYHETPSNIHHLWKAKLGSGFGGFLWQFDPWGAFNGASCKLKARCLWVGLGTPEDGSGLWRVLGDWGHQPPGRANLLRLLELLPPLAWASWAGSSGLNGTTTKKPLKLP